MSLRRLFAKLRGILRRDAIARELESEIRSHLEIAAEDRRASGDGRHEASRAAHMAFDHASLSAEDARSEWTFITFESLLQDLRYALRMLRKNPGFTAVAVFTLALGIGATTAIFSAVNPILFASLPYPHASRIVAVWDQGQSGAHSPLAFHNFRELAARSHSFEAAAALKPWQPTLTGTSAAAKLEGGRVSADFFRVLGVQPVLGRDFQPSDDVVRGPNVVILSDSLWRRRFAADFAILGRSIVLDDALYTVVGVMPRNFEDVLAPSAELWAPLQYDATNISDTQTREWGHHLRMIARVRPGIGIEKATRELDSIAQTPASEFPRPRWASLAHGLIVNSLQSDVTRGVKPALLAVLGAVFLVLIIAAVNVTNLLLTRIPLRAREFSMRAALGAARGRIVRQLLIESLLLAAIGGGFGVVVAQLGVRFVIALSPAGLPRLSAIAIDGPVLAFTFAITAAIGMAVGLFPALRMSRADLQSSIQRSSTRNTPSQQWTRRALVVVQVSLAVILLVGAGLLLRSLTRIFAIDPGFSASHVLTMQIQTAGRAVEADAAKHAFFRAALQKVKEVPGVNVAALTSQLPISGDLDEYGAQFEGDAAASGYSVYRYSVTPEYFDAMHVPLRKGRLLDDHDVAGSLPVLLISESLAQRKFAAENPIGKRVRVGGGPNAPWYTIVGIVGDVRQVSLALNQSDAVYTHTEQWPSADDSMSVVVRTRGDAASMAAAVRGAISSVDKDQPILRVATMDSLLLKSEAERRFSQILFAAFGITALLLAAIGLYGVLTSNVTERTREIGIRSALGATRGSILALVAGQGMSLVVIGAALGLAGAVVATKAVNSMLYGVSHLDVLTYAGVAGLLVAVSAVACVLPAWRASRVDPCVALRSE